MDHNVIKANIIILIFFLSWGCILGQSEVKEKRDHSTSSSWFFNKANEYLEKDSIANAILHYEKALLIDPGNSTIRKNLQIAKGRVVNTISEIPPFILVKYWKSFTRLFQPNTWAWISILLFLTLVLVLFNILFRNAFTDWRVRFILLFLLSGLTILSIIAGHIRKKEFTEARNAIIFKTTSIMSGPDSRSTELERINPGTKIIVQDSLNGWFKIKTEGLQDGWIHGADYEMIEL